MRGRITVASVVRVSVAALHLGNTTALPTLNCYRDA
jgi:hypothetical protein